MCDVYALCTQLDRKRDRFSCFCEMVILQYNITSVSMIVDPVGRVETRFDATYNNNNNMIYTLRSLQQSAL